MTLWEILLLLVLMSLNGFLAMARSALINVRKARLRQLIEEGVETIQELRREFPQAKVIALSGGGKTNAFDLLRVASHLGANKTMSKPFNPMDLVEAVQELLEPTASDDNSKPDSPS